MKWLGYLGPYGGLLVVALVLTAGYYAISFHLHPDLHTQVFKILLEAVKEDFRFFFLLIDPLLFYLGFALATFSVLLIGYAILKFIQGGKEVRQAELFSSKNQAVAVSLPDDLKEALGEEYEKVKPMILQYRSLFAQALNLFKNLPASRGYHHAEPYGLFRHSVSVAYKLFKEADRIAEMINIDKETAKKVAVVLGLFHDAGKVFKGVQFKFQNALGVILLGKIDIDIPPDLLSRIAYAITIQHTEYAPLDPEPLVKILRSLDAQDTQEDIEKKRKKFMIEFLSVLKQRVESISDEWNHKKYFKVIYNPHKKELLVNMRIFDEVYEFMTRQGSAITKGDLLTFLMKDGYVKPVGDGGFASFEIEKIGKFPAILFDTEKFPVRTPTVDFVPDYIPAYQKKEREEFLKALSELINELGEKVNDPTSPVVFYKDQEGREWLIVRSQTLEVLKEKGLNYTNLNDLGERTGFQPEKVNLRSLKISTKVIKIPAEVLK